MIVFTVKGDIRELSCNNGIFVVKNHSMICVLCVVRPEGMGPNVECIRGVLYDDVELECIPCPTGYFSDIRGTDSCQKCEKCLEYEKFCKPESNSICVDSAQGIMAKLIIAKRFRTETTKTIKLIYFNCFGYLFYCVTCFGGYFSLIVFHKNEIILFGLMCFKVYPVGVNLFLTFFDVSFIPMFVLTFDLISFA